MKIVIEVQGGIVQNVYSDEEAEVVVVDYDVEGLEASETIKVKGDEAYVYKGIVSTEYDPNEVELILNDIKKSEAAE